MTRGSPADEIRSLLLRDPAHGRALLSLLAKAKIGTADDAFVTLYTLAAAGPHTECFVSRSGQVDFDGLIKASARMDPEVRAMIRLAAALSEPALAADISETFGALAETPSFDVALHALWLRWEF